MNYEDLKNLPQINGVTIIGERTMEDYGLVPLNSKEIEELYLEGIGYVLEEREETE